MRSTSCGSLALALTLHLAISLSFPSLGQAQPIIGGDDVIQTTVMLPSRPYIVGSSDRASIGSTITMTCQDLGQGSVTRIKICIGMGDAVTLGQAKTLPELLGGTGESTVNVMITTLVVVVKTTCNGMSQPISLAAARSYITKTATQIKICSYDKMQFDMAKMDVMEVTMNRCDLLTKCDASGISDEAWDLVVAAKGTGVTQRQFSHWQIIVPQGSGCDRSWAALAQIEFAAWDLVVADRGSGVTRGQLGCWQIIVPQGSCCDRSWAALVLDGTSFDPFLGKPTSTWHTPGSFGTSFDRSLRKPTTTWYTAGDFGIRRVSTVMQEILHNFGIYHGSVDAVKDDLCQCHVTDSCGRDDCHKEYGDYSTCMGYGDACPSAVENYRLEWAKAIDTLTGSNLPEGIIKNLQVYATYIGPRTLVRVKPDWIVNRGMNLYFSMRMNKGGDVDLQSQFVGKVSVHSISSSVDERASNENGDIHLLRVVGPNSVYDFSKMKLRLIVGALNTNDDSIIMGFCRYASDPSKECKEPPILPGKEKKGREAGGKSPSRPQEVLAFGSCLTELSNCFAYTLNKNGEGCLKSRSSPRTTNSDILCLYAFQPAPAPPPPVGAKSCPFADRFEVSYNIDNNAEGQCRTLQTVEQMVKWCDSLIWCWAFSLNILGTGCVKKAAYNTFANKDVQCFYRYTGESSLIPPPPAADAVTCPEVDRFTPLGQLENNYNIKCRENYDVIASRDWCDMLPDCYAFATYTGGKGCVKSSSYNTFPFAASECFYRYTGELVDGGDSYPPSYEKPPSYEYPPSYDYPPYYY
eukprot:gene26379-17473_t